MAFVHACIVLQVVLQNLLSSHRLCLVLDLDHTLVNSAKFSEVDADWEYRLEQLAAEQVGVAMY
jgi:predicted HAD superfamily phosphohydrolase YqeG